MEVTLRALLDEAIELIQSNKKGTTEGLKQAEENLLIVLENKDVLTAAFFLACVYEKQQRTGLARLIFKYCISRDENHVQAYNNLGVLEKRCQNNEAALKCFEKALEIMQKNKPQHIQNKELNILLSDIHANIGSMYVANGTPEKAIEYLNKSLEYDPSHSVAKWNRTLAYLETGDYEKGFENYHMGERYAMRKERTYHRGYQTPHWDGDKEKIVVLFGEQGIGDEIMFASILPDMMKDCRVILDAHPRLAKMFRRAFPGMPIYATRKDQHFEWAGFHKIDAAGPMGNAVKYYRKKKEDFPGTPYLTPDLSLLPKINDHLNELDISKPTIGFSWVGGSKSTNRNERYIALDKWNKIFDLPFNFVSLQYDKASRKELDLYQECYDRGNVFHWQDVLDDYDLTAVLLTQIHYIVSVPQSVVHLAGAIGAPALQLCPVKSLWQCGKYGENMPWYNSVENLWQKDDGDWDWVLEEVYKRLTGMFKDELNADK